MNEINANQKGNFVDSISKFQQSTIFYKVFETFPLGLFQVDDEDKIVRVNQKFVEMLEYNNKAEIQGKHFNEFCEDKDQPDAYINAVKEKKFTRDILRLKSAKDKIIEVECYSRLIDESGSARWGMIDDVTARERYYGALKRLPTGFFYVENDRIKDCNDHFVRIQGFENKEAAIGYDIKKLFANDAIREKYLLDLKEADKKGGALHNYEIQVKRINDGEILTVSIDSQLVKDSKGNTIGREGTVRDITAKREMEKNLEKIQAEIHKLLHTLFHPAVKFAGKSKALFQAANILQQTMSPRTPLPSDSRELARELMNQLLYIKQNLPKHEDIKPLLKITLEEKLSTIINVFDNTMQTAKDRVILDSKIMDTASWVLEELNGINYSREETLKSLIKKDFIEFLQGIIIRYLKMETEILMAETEIMNRRVESMRSYITLEKQRKYSFSRHDIKEILEENTRMFTPLLSEKNIDIELKIRGNLTAEISKQDVDRVISNLFQNVRNYSYKGEDRNARFVKIMARELQPQNQVELSMENLGIPIKQEEIDSGNLFRFGYRGFFSYKGDRDGIGVGLADAKDVLDAHGGGISIASKPIEEDGNPPRYQAPYLTKVTMWIPKKQKE
jgi:PAS domain S-box-containing protein